MHRGIELVLQNFEDGGAEAITLIVGRRKDLRPLHFERRQANRIVRVVHRGEQ